jgi:uncharacterized protein with HEPN domain
MTVNRLPDFLGHIQQAAEDACGFVDGLSKAEFLVDKRTQNAVVMSLVVIGEAASKVMDLYPEFAERNPDVPWRSMRGMRNRIAHGTRRRLPGRRCWGSTRRCWRRISRCFTDLQVLPGLPRWQAKGSARERASYRGGVGMAVVLLNHVWFM